MFAWMVCASATSFLYGMTCTTQVPSIIIISCLVLHPGIRWGWCGLCFGHKPTELAHSFVFCSCANFCLYGPSNCISFHKFSRQFSTFSLCSSGLNSALWVLSTIYLSVKVFFSHNIFLCGWLGLKHQLTSTIDLASNIKNQPINGKSLPN